MTVKVNGAADLQAWANSKSCERWKADRSCGHDACVHAQRAVDVLGALQAASPGEWSLSESNVHLTA